MGRAPMGREGRTVQAGLKISQQEVALLSQAFGTPGKGLRWLLDSWRQGEPLPQPPSESAKFVALGQAIVDGMEAGIRGHGAHPDLTDFGVEEEMATALALDKVKQALPPVVEEADYLTDEAPTLGTSVETIVPTSEAPLAGTIAAGVDSPNFGLGPVEVAAAIAAEKHRHKRGPLLETRYDQGVKVRTYACAVPGCPVVLS